MPLKFVFGPSGSGKSTYLYQHVIEESEKYPLKNFIVLVPEQFTMQTQKDLVSMHPRHGIMNIDVLSFARLAYRVFEETGTKQMQVLDDEGKNLILRKIAGDYENKLTVLKGNIKKLGYISEVKSVISEFTQYDIGEEEMDEIEAIIREVVQGLEEKGIPYKNIRTGIMIETPAAVMISRELARRVDFLSLGTNDLSQYTLAMDRQNPLLRNKYNDHHPAVLRMIKMVVEAGHAENKRVCICGELAADTALTEEFLKMGVDCLSVVPACILPVRKALRQVDLSQEKINEK